MKNNILPFKLGGQYEDWEFDLEICDKDRIEGCDSYYYLATTEFLGVNIDSAELIFCLDILSIVLLHFNFDSLKGFENFEKLLMKDFINKENRNNIYSYLATNEDYTEFLLHLKKFLPQLKIQIIYTASKELLQQLL